MKAEIRKRILSVRNSLDKNEIYEKSNLITQRFKNTDYYNYNSIAIYMSINSEVYTHDFIRENFKKREIFLPVIAEDSMFMSKVNTFEFESNVFGIPEPAGKVPAVPDKAVLIVPGVVFDLNRNRIGYGKGYYDRLKLQHEISIGFAFECQIVDFIPAEPHDKKVDIIITERRIII